MISDDDKKQDAPTEKPAGQDQIAQSLKRVYDDIANEPLPDRLADLLEKLKKGESA